MTFDLAEACDILEGTPEVLRVLVEPLSGDWLASSPGPDEWNSHQVLAHLLYIEEDDWMVRTNHILEVGPATPFPPVGHGDQSGRYPGATAAQLVQRFAERRATNLAELGSLGLAADDLDRQGTHPSLGPVTLRQLLATWVVHDHNHVRQLHQALASYYAGEVGPWRPLLGVLDDVEG